jgi:hypothetical protein
MEYKVTISHVKFKFRCCVTGHMNPRCTFTLQGNSREMKFLHLIKHNDKKMC